MQSIKEMAQQSGHVDLGDFWNLLLAFFTCDADSYSHLSHFFNFEDPTNIKYLVEIGIGLQNLVAELDKD